MLDMNTLKDLDYTYDTYFRSNIDERILNKIEEINSENPVSYESMMISKIKTKELIYQPNYLKKTLDLKNTNSTYNQYDQFDFIKKYDILLSNNITKKTSSLKENFSFNYNSKVQNQEKIDNLSNINKDFYINNIKNYTSYKNTDFLNNINTTYNQDVHPNGRDSKILFKDDKNSKENESIFIQEKEGLEITNDNFDKQDLLESNLDSKLVFSNPNFKESNKYIMTGLKINSRQENIKIDPSIKTIKHYENLLHSKNAPNISINEEISNKNSKLEKVPKEYFLENQNFLISKSILNSKQSFIEKQLNKHFTKHISNNNMVLKDTEEYMKKYHTKDKYMNYQGNNDCLNCNLKEKINKKFDVQFKQKFRTYDNILNTTIIEAKKLIHLKKYENAYSLLKNYLQFNKKCDDSNNHADIYYLLGEVCRLLKQYKESEYSFLEALRFEIHSNMCYFSIGQLYLEYGKQYSNSIKMFEKYLLKSKKNALNRITNDIKNNNIDEKIPYAHYYLAKAYFLINNIKSCEKNLGIAIELIENNSSFTMIREMTELLNNAKILRKESKIKSELLNNKDSIDSDTFKND